jgi:geranylgeranyl diphosphate synthase, type II
MKETCGYTTILPLRAGALIGSRGVVDLDPMITFGFEIGAAFQIRDDVLNLIADPDEYGKERLGDLIEGKRTLMLAHLVAAADTSDRSWVEGYLGRPQEHRTAEEAEVLFGVMRSYGSIEFASEFAAGVARSAELSMEGAFAGLPNSPAKEFVRTRVPFMVERRY